MTRKFILSLAIGALAAASLVSGANAMVRGPGGHPNGHPSGHPNGHPHFHHQVYWKHYREHVYVRPVGYDVRAIEPGPCTCLTKNYTPEGIVVFQDLCTKEMASAPVAGSDQAQAEQGPANYAGQTYQDYLKANPQAAPAETKKN
jgi:hypothetical protein